MGDFVGIYGRVYEPGVTNFFGQGAGLTVEYGYNSANTNPATWTNWTSAVYNTDTDGTSNDEYNGIITGIAAGTIITHLGIKQLVVIMFTEDIIQVVEVFGIVLQM